MFHFNFWDIVLICVVAIQATVLTYTSDPEKKSLILIFPFPFTFATISLGGLINATNVVGLVNLTIFTSGVWFFHSKLRINIVFSIAFFAIVYCILGVICAKILPETDTAFWVSAFVVLLFALALAFFTPCVKENPYRTDLPVWIKIPVIVAVVSSLVALKKYLSGFMSVFPMVGVIAAYEGRFMLRSICRQMPLLIICLVSLMMAAKILLKFTNIYFSLAFGWIIFIVVLRLTGKFLWSQFCMQKLKN